MHKALIALLFTALLLPAAVPDTAEAAWANPKKMKKWPDEDRAWARSFDVWMSDEEMAIFIKLKSTDERKKFLQDTGYWKRWEDLDDEVRPNIVAGEVAKDLTQDHVYMIFDKPQKIRKDFRRDAYVDVLYYDFERDRKGRFFLSPPDSQTAYKNERVEFLVVLHNGRVFWFGEKDDYQRSELFDDLAKTLEAQQQARDAANQAAFEAGQDSTSETAPDSTTEPKTETGSETEPAGEGAATEDETPEVAPGADPAPDEKTEN